MELRSSAALACSEERGRDSRAAAKRLGGIGVLAADMGTFERFLGWVMKVAGDRASEVAFGGVWC